MTKKHTKKQFLMEWMFQWCLIWWRVMLTISKNWIGIKSTTNQGKSSSLIFLYQNVLTKIGTYSQKEK